MRSRSKFDNEQNFLILFYSLRKHLKIIFTFEFDHLAWLSQFYSEWRETSKLVNLKIFATISCMRFWSKLFQIFITKTSEFCSIHQENTCKSCLHSNIIIFTNFHSFTMNEEKLQNYSIFKISDQVRVCDSGQNSNMTKTS